VAVTGTQGILVGVELLGEQPTPASRRAIEMALSLSAARGNVPTLLHCLGDRGECRPRYGAAAAALRGLARSVVAPGSALPRTLLTSGMPAAELAGQAVRMGTDLIAIGHAQGGGSVSDLLLQESPCSLLMALPDGPLNPKQIGAATDFGPVGERVVEAAIQLAGLLDAELHLIHATSAPQPARLVTPAGAPIAGTHIVDDTPAQAIEAAVRDLSLDLIVMGISSHTQGGRWRIGSTTRRVLEHVPCTLLAVTPVARIDTRVDAQ
jgi:nucleotide-binding universal stress UspA family protein